MYLDCSARTGRSRRAGKILALLVLLFPVLVGMVGLVVDSGIMMATHRQAQSAADAGAMAGAMALYRGETVANARTGASSFVTSHYSIPNANIVITIPPSSGPHAGDDRYVEALVLYPNTVRFMQVLGPSAGGIVRARAVAGYEPVSTGEGAIVLDPLARPGLSVGGGGTLRVEGAVIVNSKAAGNDQYNQWVDWGLQQYALASGKNSTIVSNYIQVKGGVDTVANYRNIDPNGTNPLFCRVPYSPDPLRLKPPPTALPAHGKMYDSDGTTVLARWPDVMTVGNNETRFFDPGIYTDIRITSNGAHVTFRPGLYILSPAQPNQGLRINGACTVVGNGVMFYTTGSNYLDVGPDGQPGVAGVDDDGDGSTDNPGQGNGPSRELGWPGSDDTAGYYDNLDDVNNARLDGPLPPTNGGDTLPNPPDPNFNQVIFPTIDINAGAANVTLSPINDASSPYHRMLFFQRRRNTSTVQIQGNAGENVLMTGTMYAKWARFSLSGGGRYDAQFVVGSMSVSGQAQVTILNTGSPPLGLANQVFLVE